MRRAPTEPIRDQHTPGHRGRLSLMMSEAAFSHSGGLIPEVKKSVTVTEGRDPIRVALVIGQLTVGGAEHQLRELLRGLDRERFAPIVYCLADATGADRLTDHVESAPLRIIGATGWERARRLAHALRADTVQLVHSWLFIANTYAWTTRWFGVRVPLVTSARNCKSQGWGHHVANVLAFRSSDRIIVNSRQVKDYIVRRYVAPSAKIDVVYNGVDTERFRPLGNGDGPLTVVTAGRLVPQKNPSLFVEAATRIHAVRPDVRFVVLGDGPLRPVVQQQIDRSGMNGVIELAGERRDVEAIFGRADLFWLTSSWEGLPNVVLEAMACALPVVATDVGGTRELFEHGKEGFLARPERVEDFVSHGLTVLNDSQARARMGEAARRRANEFSLKRMVDFTQRTYSTILGETV